MINAESGTEVVCLYRLPTADQWWLFAPHIGAVRAPLADPKQWNGLNSEAKYCESAQRTPVEYPFGINYDSDDSLRVIGDGERDFIERWLDPNTQPTERVAFLRNLHALPAVSSLETVKIAEPKRALRDRSEIKQMRVFA